MKEKFQKNAVMYSTSFDISQLFVRKRHVLELKRQ